METKRRTFGSANGLTSLAAMICLFLISLSIPEASAKRFDCRMFCKETGFHGMIGGCRCSFTLFTAKRAIRDPIDDLARLPHIGSYQPNPTESRETFNDRGFPLESSHAEKLEQGQELPLKFRYLRYVKLSPEMEDASNFRTAPAGNPEHRLAFGDVTKKQQEIEQDMDNGETTDFLRMPY